MPSRSNKANPVARVDTVPDPLPTSRTTRSATRSAAPKNPSTKKRSVPEEDTLPVQPRPPKTQKNNVQTVHTTIPSNPPSSSNHHNFNTSSAPVHSTALSNLPSTSNHHGFNTSVHSTVGPQSSHAFQPAPRHVNFQTTEHFLPITQRSQPSPHQWALHQQWASPDPGPMHSTMPPAPHANYVHYSRPPPYQPQRPPRGAIIDIEDSFSSGGEELEAEQQGEGEDDSSSVQFHQSKDVLQEHRRRNGAPASGRVSPSPTSFVQSTKRVHVIEPTPVQPTSSTAMGHPPPPTKPLTFMQGASAHLTPEPMFTFDRNPEPPKPAPPPPASPPFSSEMPSIAPALPTPPEGYKATILDYPQAWQNLINSAGLQLLNDMLFAHPFPIGHDGLRDHRETFCTLALRSARNYRGKLKPKVLECIYASPELGITRNSPATSIANRVETLLHGYRYLDAPYQGDERPPRAMYGSQVLRKVVRILYQSYPWTAAIKLHHIGPAVGDDEPHQVLPSAHWEFFPPISFVAFAATAYRNALDCLNCWGDGTVDFSEHTYRSIYDELYDKIDSDCSNPIFGLEVRETLASFIPYPR